MYRKGELTPRKIRRDFPHFVEIEIPGSGLRERVAVIDRWLDENAGRGNYAFTRRHERATIREWLQVRFKELSVAESFRKAFVAGVGDDFGPRLLARKGRVPKGTLTD